jgi:hypothetical protein
MSKIKKIAGLLFLTLCMVRVIAQNNDTIINKLTQYVSIINPDPINPS